MAQAGLAFPGDGEMARLMRAHAWADGPLGPVDDWPASLRTAVRICLTSRFPMILWWGPELRFLYNDAYLPLLGVNHPALGKPGERVWSEIWHIIGPMLRSVLDTGEATWSEDLLLPMRRHGYLEETYWTYSYSPLHDDDGVVRGVFTAVSDTTERVVGERRLAVLHDLGARAGDARDVDEACALLVDALTGRDVPYAELHLRDAGGGLRRVAAGPGEPPPEGTWPLRGVLESGAPAVVEDLRLLDPPLPAGDWQAPPQRAAVLPLRGDGDEPVGVVVLAACAGRELDEPHRAFLSLVARQCAAVVNAALAYRAQQRRAEELAELDRAKTAFFANISHEFRTPLTLITGPLQELRARAGPGERAELDVVHRNALRLGRLVTALLDFSRIEAGRMRARYEPVDLAVVTAELASTFRSAVEKAGLEFRVDCPPLGVPVHLDRGMWENVVLNLLSNALKFTFGGGIRVEVHREGDNAVVTVADTGVGVPVDELPRLFERFHRIENTRARSAEGSGIGLALVRELVGLHGGEISAAGAPGGGTAFTIRLPLGTAHLPADAVVAAGGGPRASGAEPYLQEALRWLPDDRDPADDPADAPGAAPLSQSPLRAPESALPARVVVADDNADMREYLTRLLRSAGYRVRAVADGRAALEEVRARTPDLVVTDVMMPRLDGLGLVAALRADQRTAGVPVVLLSARAGQEASIEGLAAGADDYLVKPFAAADLLARVRANVELARLRDHHARWRAALLDSLQEAFFVCDETGAVVEINAAFTTVLGYGPEGLPYGPVYPWWPTAEDDPEGHARVEEVFTDLVGPGSGAHTVVPVVHRDGHRLWVAAAFNRVEDPDTGDRVVVGTFRDVTDEHYAAVREAAVAALSVRLSEADGVSDALVGALGELDGLWRAERVVALVGAGGEELLTTERLPEGEEPGSRCPNADRAPVAPATAEALRAALDRPPLVAHSDGPGLVGITLEHPAGMLALRVELGGSRRFAAQDEALLVLLAGHLGQALHRLHHVDVQRETALALQRAILGPQELPGGFAARYEPATRPLEVGGDWYDIVPLAGGRTGIVVGDCVGHGLHSATAMGQLRSACRALLLQDSGPAQTLSALDRFAMTVPGARCTTVFCGVLSPDTGHLVYASAGHPPGVLARPGGGVELLDGGRSLPLAVQPDRPRTEAWCDVPARGTLLLYTDGLVERRRQSLDDGIELAGRALQEGRDVSVEDLAAHVMSRLAPAAGFEDDVAVLLYRRPGPLVVEFPADALELTRVRGLLRDWLAACGVGRGQAQNVLVAAGEACANAVEHGHRDRPGGQVVLRASATVERLRLVVADSGAWRAPVAGGDLARGHGIGLMRALVDEVAVRPGPGGTVVELRTRITP
ncbi:SpoIIE family protein phosphatase [Actinosynnema pretiosum subsp. pretiosum]|uniref:histidine kinase n=1 Tax=Actinosynnema pretiosum subsp. pretiosum TaxID=103721 RepID=A0AA45R4C9_9PSEU|nr:Serine phosphatase RsbU, regulator of sigma subunit [Actinosynnema pretiosum subsp. pretiosum]QUF04639.1 SpoIIE family protein phosphatase [Actinosynnema pretiosum subsp. pretiosum]